MQFIHASIDEDLIQIYERKVSSEEYMTNLFPYKLTFYRTTNIIPCDDFSEIHSGIFENDIVHVGALTEIYAKEKQTNKLNVILRDESASNLTCTLWGDYGKHKTTTQLLFVLCVSHVLPSTINYSPKILTQIYTIVLLYFVNHEFMVFLMFPRDDIGLSRHDGLFGSTVSWH
ncbi:hypothetical protein HID58_093903, partial [Brassica napus]